MTRAKTTTDNERTPLLLQQQQQEEGTVQVDQEDDDDVAVSTQQQQDSTTTTTTTDYYYYSQQQKIQIYNFLEGKTYYGKIYEQFMIGIIIINVIAFIIGTLFDTQYNTNTVWAQRYTGICSDICDRWFFGNYRNNGLEFLHLSTSTSILEIFTILLFTIDYILRFYTADISNNELYSGWIGRLRWILSFFSIVDLLSTVPFYIDAFILRQTDFTGTAFVRMFRLLRILQVEGRYDTALTMVDDVFKQQQSILITASFVGITTWIVVSSLYYLTERTNPNFIYCPSCPDVDTDSYCSIDSWGFVNCTGDPCVDNVTTTTLSTSSSLSTTSAVVVCYNLYESIPSASYYALLNLFGEFPHITDHSSAGKFVAVLTTVVAVAVFALPVGIIGNGFEQVIEQKRQLKLKLLTFTTSTTDDNNNNTNTNNQEEELVVEDLRQKDAVLTRNYHASDMTTRGQLYNILHAQIGTVATIIDSFINILIVTTAVQYMIETTGYLSRSESYGLDVFELVAVTIFTIEYFCRVYSCVEDPMYSTTTTTNVTGGRIKYMITFLALVDLLSFLPYWIQKTFLLSYITDNGGNWLFTGNDTNDITSTIISSLRLLRILRFERYTHAFTTFDDVFSRNVDVLAITAYTAILVWIFFAAILYVTERSNPNVEMSSNYNTIPNSMWITLLNLSGEAPLSEYTIIGKVVTGILGVFATGIFGIPIGVLGAGFEQIVADENKDHVEELAGSTSLQSDTRTGTTSEDDSNEESSTTSSSIELFFYNFANGIGSIAAQQFELLIYFFIFVAVAVGCYQTIDGQADAFSEIEWIAVIIFTIEYIFRLIGAGADPLFYIPPSQRNSITWPIVCRLRFIISFYSIIDLLAIVPFYLSIALPNSFVNDYDEYLRMLRIIRLVKLDKYVPSITLVDDVLRLKFEPLCVAFYAAATLWALFAAAMFLCEQNDTSNGIDPVPAYGCVDDCSMADRFQNFFDSVYYAGIHLTGDYPITTYSWPARLVCFFMVIAAVGVVSIPSGLIASGFVEIVKNRSRAAAAAASTEEETTARATTQHEAGDDWYEIQYRLLEGVQPKGSICGGPIDMWQITVNEFLNGRKARDGSTETVWTPLSYCVRVFIFLIIVANVLAVVLESIPAIDKAVGNQSGNFFDRFEVVSVFIFATEYILRLFCAPKNREALYSTWVYATTFFGIVDFLSTAPWFIEQLLLTYGLINPDDVFTKTFRIFRIFRILQLEDFLVAFRKLDNVFRASKDVLKATGLLALIIWVGCGALFFIFEENNPNWRSCKDDIPPYSDNPKMPGCYDFKTTGDCNKVYPGMCDQAAFTDMPNTLYYTAVFLGGEWGLVDFTWPGRMVALFLCVFGIGLYAIPIGTLFNSFGAVLGLAEDEDEGEEEIGQDEVNNASAGTEQATNGQE